MHLGAPEWLLLIPVFMFLGWYWPQVRLHLPRRILCVLLVVAILVRPEVKTIGKGLDVWVLVDRSDSASELVEPRLSEFNTILNRSKGSDDSLRYLDFAQDVLVRGEGESAQYVGGRGATNLGLALRYALAQRTEGRHTRFLILSDGFSTEPLDTVLEPLLSQQVPVDYRILSEANGGDYVVDSVQIVSQVQPDEPFLIEGRIVGEPDGEIPFQLSRGDTVINSGTVVVRDGVGVVRLQDALARPGSFRYSLRILPKVDSFSFNNAAEQWVEVSGGPRVLLITSYASDPLIPILNAQGFSVDSVSDPGTLMIGHLSGARAVIVNNVPAYHLPNEFLESLNFFVVDQGGGLLMVGGKQSFGSGGYFRSPIDPLLPVSMELRSEHRKFSVAMSIVMDRSGSMGAGVEGGRSKMDLANDGAARSLALLGDTDLISVFAVDSEAHEIAPLTSVGGNQDYLAGVIRGVTSQGGGIYVYTGLEAAWKQLRSAPVPQRHVILFSDAADSEEPGSYKKLVADMVAGGTTVSVIALGSEFDSDAGLLKDIAERGGGRIFFNADANEVPAIFEQETVAVARSAFIKEPVEAASTGGWSEISQQSFPWLSAVDGYNLSYIRPEATAALLSLDEYEAPLVAYWNRGVGRTAAVSFPLGGDYSQRARAWPAYGDFCRSLTRWLAAEDLPEGLSVQPRVRGSELQVELQFSSDWLETFSKKPPRLVISRGKEKTTEELTWELLQPGRYGAVLQMNAADRIRGALQLGQATVPFGPYAIGTDPEWRFNRETLREFKNLSKLSGGKERLDLSTIWSAPRDATYEPITLWLLIPLLVMLLFDALLTRTGYVVPLIGKLSFPQIHWKLPKRQVKRKEAVSDIPTEKPIEMASEDPAAEARKSRFERAKQRKR